MTIISGTADHRFPIFVSIFIIVVWNMPKYPHLFQSLDQAIFWNIMLRLPQMAFLGSIFQKFSGGAYPRTPLGCLTPSARVCMTTHTTLASPLSGLRSCSKDLLETPIDRDIFQYSAAKCFNKLPQTLRAEKNLETFCAETRVFLFDHARERLG
jgi:hypothetical protein